MKYLERCLDVEEFVLFEAATFANGPNRNLVLEDLKPPCTLGKIKIAQETMSNYIWSWSQWFKSGVGRMDNRNVEATSLADGVVGERDVRRCRLICDGVPV